MAGEYAKRKKSFMEGKHRRASRKKLKNGCTVAQMAAVKEIAKDPTISTAQAGRNAGFLSPEACQRALSKPEVRSALLKELDKKGITFETIAEMVEAGLKANKFVTKYLFDHTDASGRSRQITEEEPDLAMRDKYLGRVLDLTGANDKEQEESANDRPNQTLIVNVQSSTPEELAENLLNKLTERKK